MRKFLALFLLLTPFSVFAQQRPDPANPLGGQINATGACTLFNACVWQRLPGNASSSSVTITGTFVATLIIETSADGGNTFTTQSTQTGSTVVTFSTTSFTDVRVRCSAYTSGVASVTINTGLLQVQSVVTVQGSGGVSPNSPLPLATSGPGPVFNVLNYGAVNDAQSTATNACTSSATTTIVCTNAGFSSPRDVGKTFFCANGGSSFYSTLTTISSVTNSTTIVTSQASSFNGSTCTGVWGTLTAASENAVTNAVTAAIAQSTAAQGGGKKGVNTAAPIVYFPAGGYLFCTDLLNGVVSLNGTIDGFTILGDGRDHTIWYAGSGATPCPLTSNSNLGSFVTTGGSVNNVTIKGITFDGANNSNGGSVSSGLGLSGGVNLQDVTVQRWGGNFGAAIHLQGSHFADRILAVNNQGVGIQCDTCGADLNNIGTSNNGNSANLVFNGVIGSPTGYGARVRGGSIIDECGTNSTGCTQLINSRDVWFEGVSAFGTPNGFCVNVDANSYLHWIGGICGTFNNDTNTNGPRIAAGGTIAASDLRMISTGTGKSATNNGLFLDNGNNTFESMFQIVSGTSTATAAVLTVTTLGANANTNCAVGDSIQVDGAGIAGYNGYFSGAITGVTATTISYTTVASNIGALGAGGVAYCKNYKNYSGTLPTPLLTPSQLNGFQSGTLAAGTVQTWVTDRAIYFINLTWTPSNAAACTAGSFPVIQLTDGTITLSTSVSDTFSSGAVTHSFGAQTTAGLFPPNDTIQIKVSSIGTCGTAPTNVNFNAEWKAPGSN